MVKNMEVEGDFSHIKYAMTINRTPTVKSNAVINIHGRKGGGGGDYGGEEGWQKNRVGKMSTFMAKTLKNWH